MSGWRSCRAVRRPATSSTRIAPRRDIHELLAYADVVVVAATPVQSGPGALAWARAVEGTVLIARRDHAKREDVAAAAETLLHVGGNLVGAILAERAAPLAGLFGRGDQARRGPCPRCRRGAR